MRQYCSVCGRLGTHRGQRRRCAIGGGGLEGVTPPFEGIDHRSHLRDCRDIVPQLVAQSRRGSLLLVDLSERSAPGLLRPPTSSARQIPASVSPGRHIVICCVSSHQCLEEFSVEAPAQRKRPSPRTSICPQRRTHFETSHLKQGRSPVDPRRQASFSSRHRLQALVALAGTAARDGPAKARADVRSAGELGDSVLMMGIVRYIQMQDECGQLGGGNKQIGASADGPEGPEEGIYP
jgi:hypothetical protein